MLSDQTATTLLYTFGYRVLGKRWSTHGILLLKYSRVVESLFRRSHFARLARATTSSRQLRQAHCSRSYCKYCGMDKVYPKRFWNTVGEAIQSTHRIKYHPYLISSNKYYAFFTAWPTLPGPERLLILLPKQWEVIDRSEMKLVVSY